MAGTHTFRYKYFSPNRSFGVRSGSARGLRGVCSGFVRDLFEGRTGSMRGPCGVRSGSVRGLFGLCSGQFRTKILRKSFRGEPRNRIVIDRYKIDTAICSTGINCREQFCGVAAALKFIASGGSARVMADPDNPSYRYS